MAYKAKHSGSVLAVVETAKQAAAFVQVKADLPKLKAIVIWDPTVDINDAAALAEMKACSPDVPCYHWAELPGLAAAGKVMPADVEAVADGLKVCTVPPRRGWGLWTLNIASRSRNVFPLKQTLPDPGVAVGVTSSP